MTMGPEPMMRMRWRSSRRGTSGPPISTRSNGGHRDDAEKTMETLRFLCVLRVSALNRRLTLSILLHQLRELVEEVVRVMRAGGGFGVVLHAEDRVIAVAEAFERLVIQIDVSDVNLVHVE